MSPERTFLIWLSERPWLFVRKHRAEARAHLLKALLTGDGK